MSGPYDDILHLPHHRSATHPLMSNLQRAAQFAPFAALTGHEAAVQEAARLTEQRIDLDEEQKLRLNQRLILAADSGEVWQFTWFVADPHKEGGAYITRPGRIRRLDGVNRFAELTDRTRIPVDDLVEIIPAHTEYSAEGDTPGISS